MKNLLFFSRAGHHRMFCEFKFDEYNPCHAVINKREKEKVQAKGGRVIGCFEELYDRLPVISFPETYLMNGFQSDRFLGGLSLQERRKALGKLISFWRYVLERRSFEAVVHETISIEQEEVLSIEAKRHGIDDLTFLGSVVDGYLYWKPDPYNSSFPREMLRRAAPSSHHRKMANRHVEKVLNKGHYPNYLKRVNATYAPSMAKVHLWKSIKSNIRKLVSSHTPRSEYIRKCLFYYNFHTPTDQTRTQKLIDTVCARFESYDRIADTGEHEFVFFPLHVEPEATLRYFAPKFSNQLGVIDLVARFLPANQYLVVKEHPNRPSHLLRRKYSQLRRSNSNILYLPAEVSSERLIQKCNTVMTISGTVGWEAAVYGRPVIALGDVFYDKHPGVTKVSSIDALRSALRGDVEAPVSRETTIEYLSKILSYSCPGKLYSSDHWDEEENIKNIQAGLIQSLHRAETDTRLDAVHDAQ